MEDGSYLFGTGVYVYPCIHVPVLCSYEKVKEKYVSELTVIKILSFYISITIVFYLLFDYMYYCIYFMLKMDKNQNLGLSDT
jgi:hypothetical protein|tara:strand:+ start:646 stop:891 length:246 start_codon:yes stop_codon:yes gene_type:complete